MRNKLLHRQIQKHLGGPDRISQEYDSFLDAISQTYDAYEQDRKLLEHSIEISSDEMTELNNALRKEAAELRGTYVEIDRILNNIGEAFFSVDPIAKKYVFISPACEEIYGYTIEEFKSTLMLWRDVIHPEDVHLTDANDERLSHGETVNLQYRIIHKNKSVRWVNVKVVPTIESGELIRRNAVVVDITEQKEAEQQLAKANDELQMLFNNMDDVMYSVDMTSYQLIQMSPACMQIYGYTPADFYSDRDLWNKVIHPDDRHLLEDHNAKLDGGKQVKNQYRVIHKDQSIRWVENSIIPTLGPNGRLIRLDGITRDITEKRIAAENLEKANHELNRLFNTVDEVIYSVDTMNGKITHMSPACESIYGYKPSDFYADIELWTKVTHPDDQYKIAEHYPKLMTGEQVIDKCRIINKDNELRWVEYNMVPTLNDEGMLIRIDGVTRDITDKKLAEDRIKALNESLEDKVKERTKQLQTAVDDLEAFSYSVSHDLRSPLRIISGFGAMLLSTCSGKLDEEETESVNIMMDTARRMGELIDDLLEFSRVGRASLVKTQVDMNRVVGEVLRELNISDDSSNALIVQKDLGLSESDPKLIKQVWVNLISNALKYSSKKDKPVIDIGVMNDSDNTIYYVKDNGAGFDMSHADKLFGVFQRLHKVAEYEGTGVGLALAHRIVTRHGGKIWAEAKVNEGATFYFTLPQTAKKIMYEAKY